MALVETAHHTLRVRRRGHRVYLDILDKLGNPVWSDDRRVEVSMHCGQVEELRFALTGAESVARHVRPGPLPDVPESNEAGG